MQLVGMIRKRHMAAIERKVKCLIDVQLCRAFTGDNHAFEPLATCPTEHSRPCLGAKP